MTTANRITIVRILLVPLFVVEVLNYVGHGKELHRFLAICTFLVAAVCDGVDGYIARRYNQRSELGAILDPLGDKLLLVGLAVVHYACGKVTVKPHLIGKVATVLQMIAVCWALLKLPLDWLRWFAIGAAVCTGVSGFIYVLDGVRQLSASPASSPTPRQ